MPHPDEDPDSLGKTRRRPSHFRKKARRNASTVVVRGSTERTGANESGRVVRGVGSRHEQWSDVTNPAPALPEPLLQRPMPPPAPLPSESAAHDAMSPGWLEDRHRRKRAEDIIGTVGLAILVAAMLAAMWLQMTGP